MHSHQTAIIETAIHGQAVQPGELGATHGHVLVPGLHRGATTQREHLGRRAVLIIGRRPVVIDLVIVEGRDEGEGRLGRLQVRIALILGVAAAIVVQAVDLAPDVAAAIEDRARSVPNS